MDAKLKAAWVKALRSGKYRQAKLALRKEGAFCCLGVLCRVARIPIARNGTTVSESVGGDYRPIAVILGGQTMNHLMCLNDSSDKSFPEIADYIEASL
jgi:hypothetical protein